MQSTPEDKDHQTADGLNPVTKEWWALLIIAFMTRLSATLMVLPTPAGLSVAGQRVLTMVFMAFMAIGLWCTDAIPAAVLPHPGMAGQPVLPHLPTGANRWYVTTDSTFLSEAVV